MTVGLYLIGHKIHPVLVACSVQVRANPDHSQITEPRRAVGEDGDKEGVAAL